MARIDRPTKRHEASLVSAFRGSTKSALRAFRLNVICFSQSSHDVFNPCSKLFGKASKK
jgi:hypothetical protein